MGQLQHLRAQSPSEVGCKGGRRWAITAIMPLLEIVGEETGVTERRFELSVGGEPVPGLLWSPSAGAGTGAVVLVGHGRTSHKRNPHILGLAQLLVGSCGWSAVALDAPDHGERRPPASGPSWPRPNADQVVHEWQACIGFLADTSDLDMTRLGYWGVSMGTSLGISLLAAEPRIGAAVLGLMHPNWPAPPGLRIRADAQRTSCPVLFLINWDDRLVQRADAFELFDLLGSTDKRFHGYLGEHGQLPDEAMEASRTFFARYLSSAQG